MQLSYNILRSRKEDPQACTQPVYQDMQQFMNFNEIPQNKKPSTKLAQTSSETLTFACLSFKRVEGFKYPGDGMSLSNSNEC